MPSQRARRRSRHLRPSVLGSRVIKQCRCRRSHLGARWRHTSLRSRISYQTHPPQFDSRAHWLCDIKRHVKCDETRPACLNCIKWRGYCDSYATDDATRGAKDGGAGDNAKLIHTKKAPLMLTEPLVNILRFASQDERAYFDEWAHLSVTFLSGGLDQTRLWTATMPQLSLEEPTLRYGAMAVGALRRACRSSNAPLADDNRHYLNAVMLYCEALRRQSAARPTREGLRTALLSSLLFICFEALRGNTPAALKHVTHGFTMLNELAGCTPRAPDLVSIAPAPPAMVQEILDCYKPLELQSRSFLGSYKAAFFKGDRDPPQLAGHPGGQPPSLRGDPRLMSPMSSPQRSAAVSNVQSPKSDPSTPQSQHMGVLSPRSLDSPSSQNTTPVAPTSSSTSPPSAASPSSTTPPGPGQQGPPKPPTSGPPQRPPGIAPFTKHSPYFRPKRTTITTLREMPRTFADMEETQGYWALVQRNMVQYMPLLAATSARLALAKAGSEAEVEAKLAAVRQDPAIGKFIADCRYWIRRWAEAYEPLYRAAVRRRWHDAASTAAYLHAINLRVEYLVLCVYTTVPRYAGLVTARALTPQYREIAALAETLLQARWQPPDGGVGFAMDSGWTWPLFIAAFGCREAAVRADATRILGQYPVRNALRDSRVYRAIALRNEEVERAVAADGDDEARQWVRLRRREVLFEDFGASVVLRSVRKDPDTGVWELIEEAADFQVRPDGHLNWRRQPISGATSILGGVC
ncbi:C6 zinc finger domain protein [Cordyceps fumosorosea ARSEF 2679]|uniref:C6 zinc finger domain protein n=1 Tax=Cordyceps fumosorosea (strain ARSEF 2679) TaxID=1081104 RepID=A0A167N421_CORFA|nr:C6 zinc finger domain protein [Cordyceps fumosorosea ARSEF 2679]OAA55106.1 C6 zinc finger domain protein [Cordyceps fumosorosea ARSEF 2679]